MKPIQIFCFLTLLLLFFGGNACTTPKVYLENDYVKPITSSTTANGIVYLEATGYAKKSKAEAKANAVRNAVEKVLFVGIPNSSVSRPLVNDPSARTRHQAYFDRFFSDNGAYNKYVTVNTINPTKTISVGRKGCQLAVMIELNYRNLQKELETAGIISKFGI